MQGNVMYYIVCVITTGANTIFNRAVISSGGTGPPRKNFWEVCEDSFLSQKLEVADI